MSETTLLAIVSVSCTAGSAVLTIVLQLIAGAVRTLYNNWKDRQRRQIDALSAYSEIVFRSNYSPLDSDLCKAMGAIYLYVGRKQWGLLDSINHAIMICDRDQAIELFSQLLRCLSIPRVHMRTTNPKTVPK